MNQLDLSVSALADRARNLNSTLFFDRCYEFGFILNAPLINYTPGIPLVGPVKIINVNNNILPIVQALETIPAHSLLVINDLGCDNLALLGDIVMTAVNQKSVGGVVVFGRVRDVEQAPSIGVPLWAEGVSVAPAILGKPGLDYPNKLRIGDKTLNQDDWLIGDQDGIVAIRADKFRFVLKAAEIKKRKELAFIKNMLDGKTMAELMNLQQFLDGKGSLTITF